MKLQRLSRKTTQKAMTLIEVMIVTVIGSALAYAVTTSSISFIQTSYNLAAHSEQGVKILRTLDYMSMDIRMASDVSITNNGKTMVITYNNGDEYTYALKVESDGTHLTRKDETGTTSTILKHIDSFSSSFVSGSTNSVQIDIDIDEVVHGASNAKDSISVRYSMRNS